MPTVEAILQQSGFSPEEIRRLDERAVTGFNRVLTEAQQARDAAELAQRSNVQFYEDRIVPALTGWESERNQIIADRDAAQQQARYFRSAAESAGIIPNDSPRDPVSGRYVAGAGNISGSPAFTGDVSELVNRAGQALGTLADLQWKYESLFASKLPISPSQLVQEADRAGVDPATYAARKFDFAGKEREIAAAKQKAHDDTIRLEATREADRRWAERTGSNPDVRKGEASRFTDLQRAVRQNERPDPLKLDESQRRLATRNQIRSEIAEHEAL